MESRKRGSSDTSSEESDRIDQVKNETGTTRRSYECTFCKRGFTNAQALGGHMNIHRKDRAKSKQNTSSSVSSRPNMNEEHRNPSHLPPFSSEPTNYYPFSEAQRDYFTYFAPSVSNPRYPHACPHENNHYLVPKSQSLGLNEELLGANLSLGLGSTHVDDEETKREIAKEDGLDLELRLGHDP